MSHVTTSCPFCETLNRIDLSRLDDGPRCASCSRPLHLDRPQTIPGESLDRIIAGAEVPLLIDFYADWCGPCRIMAPVIDAFAQQRAGEVLVGKVDTDQYPDAAVRFRVRGIPTLIVFVGGREVARKVGVVPEGELAALIESAEAALGPSP
jgi:thioredoxin 2